MPLPASAATARSLLAAVRAHFGLRQATLAAYLGISPSLVAMADVNCRELPTAALQRLAPLGQALPPPWSNGLPTPSAPAPPVLPAPLPALSDPPAPTPLRHRLLGCESALLRATHALALAEHRAAQARRLLAVLPALAATLPATDARARRQLPYMEANARDHLAPGPTAVRALLTIRIVALSHEVAWLRAWLPAG